MRLLISLDRLHQAVLVFVFLLLTLNLTHQPKIRIRHSQSGSSLLVNGPLRSPNLAASNAIDWSLGGLRTWFPRIQVRAQLSDLYLMGNDNRMTKRVTFCNELSCHVKIRRHHVSLKFGQCAETKCVLRSANLDRKPYGIIKHRQLCNGCNTDQCSRSGQSQCMSSTEENPLPLQGYLGVSQNWTLKV